MSFKVTISDNPQVFSKCIESIDFQVVKIEGELAEDSWDLIDA